MKLAYLVIFVLIGITSTAQRANSKYAVIEFVGDKTKNSKTYIGKIKKGNPNQLHDYLQQASASEDDTKNYAPKEYNSNKKREKFRYLSDVYDLDEKKLKKKKEKYQKRYYQEKKRIYIEEVKKNKRKEKDSDKFSFKKFKNRERIPKTKLAKKYKIRGKRIRKGQKLKYPEGNISLIIKYKIKENKMVREYVTDVNTKVISGFKYHLTYYGSGSKRRYFITKAP